MAKQKKKREKKYNPRRVEIGLPPCVVKEIPVDTDQLRDIQLVALVQADAVRRGWVTPLYFATMDGACRAALKVLDVWEDFRHTPSGFDTVIARDVVTGYRTVIHKAFDAWFQRGAIPEASLVRMMDAVKDATRLFTTANREDMIRALNRCDKTPNNWLRDRGQFSNWEPILNGEGEEYPGWMNDWRMNENESVTVKDIAEVTGWSVQLVRDKVKKGLLPAPVLKETGKAMKFRMGCVRAALRCNTGVAYVH